MSGDYTVMSRNSEDPVAELVIRKMEHEEFINRLARLTEEQQRLYVMRYEYGMTQREIGDKLGISKMAVSKRLKKLHADYLRLRDEDTQNVEDPESA